MNWKTEYTVRTHLLQEMHVQYDLRRDAIHEALQSKESMLAYRNDCRQKYLGLLGQFPGKTPLNPQITKTIKLEGYRIENILFESLPKHHVAANIYVPEGQGPFPAVLMFCGHEMTSKATESYQKTAILFAKNGFVALVVDPISQGEMVQFTDDSGKRITDLLTLIDFLDHQDSGEDLPVHLFSSGATGPVAIYGALLRPQVKSVRVSNSIQSYLDILNHPMEVDWYSYVIPNVLAYFDLPDLAALRDDLEIRFQGEKPRIEDHTINKNRKIQ